MAVRFPFKYAEARLMTRTRAWSSVVVVCFFTVVVALLPIADQLGSRTAPPRFKYFLDYMTLTFTLETLVNHLNDPGELGHFLPKPFSTDHEQLVMISNNF